MTDSSEYALQQLIEGVGRVKPNESAIYDLRNGTTKTDVNPQMKHEKISRYTYVAVTGDWIKLVLNPSTDRVEIALDNKAYYLIEPDTELKAEVPLGSSLIIWHY